MSAKPKAKVSGPRAGLLTPRQAAPLLGVNHNVARELMRVGRVRAINIGTGAAHPGWYRTRREWVDEFLGGVKTAN